LLNLEGFEFMLAEMEMLTLGKAEIMVAAWTRARELAEYPVARQRLLRLSSPAEQERAVAEVPLGSIRYEALESGSVFADEDQRAVNEAVIIAALAVLHQEALTGAEFETATFAWNFVLRFPWEA
jgi:hypothetical protein